MKIQFIGATHEVTGSCTLLEVNRRYYLVDCGMEQGKDVSKYQPADSRQSDRCGLFDSRAYRPFGNAAEIIQGRLSRNDLRNGRDVRSL